jgi:hypothetical protein
MRSIVKLCLAQIRRSTKWSLRDKLTEPTIGDIAIRFKAIKEQWC